MKLSIGNFFGMLGQKVRDHKSDLLMAFGTGGVLVGTGLLCRETLKAQDIVAEYRYDKEALEAAEAEKKEVRKLQAKTAGKLALNFLPGATMEGAGLVSMWGGYSDVKATCVGIGAAYTGLQTFVEHYREGVRERYGEDVDEELAYGCRTEEVVKVAEDGTETTETVKVFPRNRNGMPSPYARYFCYGEADGAEKSDTYNLHFLQLQEKAANRYFRARKKMMLNELYEMLGIKLSVAGNHVGWIFDKNAPEGDNYIDLRIQEVYREREDGDGWEKVYMIDPNVDGMVEEKMLRLGLMDA